MTAPEFVAFPKIARLANEHMTITEKIDGTNGCIIIEQLYANNSHEVDGSWYNIYCQSRNRLIAPGSDNAGFARWAHANGADLVRDLGIGRFYGEWWGLGIQRNYGLTEKRFSLFNSYRWSKAAPYFKTPRLGVVPVLFEGKLDTDMIGEIHERLMYDGSAAAPGWTTPEGVVVYLAESRTSYKITDAAAGPSKPRLETE